ncbi:hypothetical protein [Bizionia sp.]|uniref:hypothetical protein n=1 Tax=Bizionia sp. TaxID=1954480 RepID=UPI003A94C2B2
MCRANLYGKIPTKKVKKVHNTTTGEIDYFKEDGSRLIREYLVGELLEGAPANHYYS